MGKTSRKAGTPSSSRTSVVRSQSATPANHTAPAPLGAEERGLTHEQIAQRAYEIYLKRGGGSGRELDDWVEAERQLTQRIA